MKCFEELQLRSMFLSTAVSLNGQYCLIQLTKIFLHFSKLLLKTLQSCSRITEREDREN